MGNDGSGWRRWLDWWRPAFLRDGLFLAGITGLAVGLWQVYPPLTWITVGGACVALAVYSHLRSPPS